MCSIQQSSTFNQGGGTSPADLSTLDLIDHMTAYHEEQAKLLAEIASWHRAEAEALAVERCALAADVGAALAEAERLLA